MELATRDAPLDGPVPIEFVEGDAAGNRGIQAGNASELRDRDHAGTPFDEAVRQSPPLVADDHRRTIREAKGGQIGRVLGYLDSHGRKRRVPAPLEESLVVRNLN